VTRKLPTVVAAAFLAIQLQRVADFVAHGLNGGPVLGWAFAVGLALAVFTSGYWTRQSVTRADGKEDQRDVQARVSAWISLIIFVALDGTFNLAETLRVLVDQSLRWAAVIYGVSPTIAAAGLGMLQGRIDRLPVPPRKSRVGGVLNAALDSIERMLAQGNPAALPDVAGNEIGKDASKPGKKSKVAPQVARKPVKDDELLAYLASNPGESHQQVADHFHVSRQAIGQRVKKLYEVKQ
jgi:hypothetical protein